MNEFNILILNTVLYLFGYLYFTIRYGKLNLSSIGMLFYLITSLMSILFFITPIFVYTFSNDGNLNIEGTFWLFVFNFLLCNVLHKFNFKNTNIITSYNHDFISKIQIFLVFVFLTILIFDFPVTIKNLLSTNLSDLRDLTYTDGGINSNFFIISLLKRVFGELNLLLVAIAFFNILILKRKNKIDIISIIIYFLVLINTMAEYISRSVIVYRLVGLFIIFILLREFINNRYKKYIFYFSIPLLFFLITFFNNVTNSRFVSGSNQVNAELFANLRYTGEPQINFISLMYDETKDLALGYRSFPLFRKALNLEYFGQSGSDKADNLIILDKIHPHPNYIFYTAAGDWYLDFGKIVPIIFLLIINVFIKNINGNIKTFDFFNYLLAIYLSYYVINGVFYAQFQSEAGNFLILFFIAIYFNCRLRIRVLFSKFSIGFNKINGKWIRVDLKNLD